jgi:hypothetical protein
MEDDMTRRVVGLLVAGAVVAALACGCAPAAPRATGAAESLPGWVTMAMPTEGERLLYVGGCSAAADTASGMAAAEGDARQQAERAAQEEMRGLSTRAFKEARVELTSTERGVLGQKTVGVVSGRLRDALRRDRAFYRPCEEGVCDVFVRMSADRGVWDRTRAEALSDLLREERGAAGDTPYARVLDWMLQHSDDVSPRHEEGPGRGAESEGGPRP